MGRIQYEYPGTADGYIISFHWKNNENFMNIYIYWHCGIENIMHACELYAVKNVAI